MEEKPAAQMDFLQQWVEMQERLWKESMAMGQKMLAAMPFGPGEKGISGFTKQHFFHSDVVFDLLDMFSANSVT